VQEKYCDSTLSDAWKLLTGFIQEVIYDTILFHTLVSIEGYKVTSKSRLNEWMHLSSYKPTDTQKQINFSLFSEISTNSFLYVIRLLFVLGLIQGSEYESFFHDELALCSQKNYVSRCLHYMKQLYVYEQALFINLLSLFRFIDFDCIS
jgi:hypothetical protein